jgi:hypothetical protein
MKNVAGYDLTKFMVGQHGVFGRLVTMTTRTYKRPSGALLARFDLSADRVGKLLPTPARPQWAMISGGALWCGYYGDERAMALYQSSLKQFGAIELVTQSLQQDIDFRAARWLPQRPPNRFRVSVPPSDIVGFIRNAQLTSYAADAAFGIVVGSCVAHHKGVLCQVAQQFGGEVFFDDPADVHGFYNAHGPQLALMERIQSAFGA